MTLDNSLVQTYNKNPNCHGPVSQLMNQKKICVVAPDFSIGGGFYIIQDLIRALKEDDYDVTVATPGGQHHFANRQYNCTISSTSSFNSKNHDIFDALVFTWWESIFWACHIKTKRIVWLSQSIEDYFLPESQATERVNALTPYMLRGIETIAVSPWIQARLDVRFGIKSTLISNQLSDTAFVWKDFSPKRSWEDKESPNQCKFIVEGSNAPYKNLEEAIETVDRLQPKEKTLVFSGVGIDKNFINGLTDKGWRVLTNLDRKTVIQELSNHDVL